MKPAGEGDEDEGGGGMEEEGGGGGDEDAADEDRDIPQRKKQPSFLMSLALLTQQEVRSGEGDQGGGVKAENQV